MECQPKTEKLMNQLQMGKTSSTAVTGKKKPDVIVTHANQTMLFKTQNHRVSEWLRRHYRLSTGNINGDTELRVHPSRCKRLIAELKAAGFTTTDGNEELY
jgi:hypothetical protein